MGRKNRAMKNQGMKENLPNLVKESEKLENELGNGIAQFSPFGYPQGYGSAPYSEQISNVNTIFKNLRWYLVSNFRQVLSEAYVELGLVQTITDVPVDDALRGGITIKSKQLEEEQIEELQISLDRDDDVNTVGQAAKWNRLFGGAGVIILTDQDPETPLELDQIGPDTPLEFRAVDMWELFWDKQNTEGYDPSIQSQDFETYSYYGEKLHKSRVMRLKGLTAPSFIRPRLRGWGFSVVEILVRSINQYLKGTDLAFEVLDEFKIDVYKIKNLVNTLLSPLGQEKINRRIQHGNWLKNYQNALVMDSEDDFDHKQLSFTGIAEAMDGIRMQVAADMRMPRSKLFGEGANGLNNGGNEGDLEVYNSMVESTVRNKIKYVILRVCEIKCQKLFGFVPDDLSIEFAPLRVLGAEQQENVKTQKFNRLLQAKAAGEITTLEFRDACNKGDLFDISLDNAGDLLNPDDPQVHDLVAEGANNPEDPQDTDDPGADREDTQKSKMFPKGEYGGRKGEASKPMRSHSAGEPSNPAPKNNEPKEKEPKNKEPENKKLNAAFLKIQEQMQQAIWTGRNTPKPFTSLERIERILKNSAAFDRASYEADGGDGWIDSKRELLFQNPGNVDEALWSRAKEASMRAFGKEKWQFVTWMYKKLGGKFIKGDR